MTKEQETLIENISCMTAKDKQGELLKMVSDFSRTIIDSIDSKLKTTSHQLIEYEYFDIIVEAIFSIRSFCLLMNEGLISNASAIMRVIVEQVSIVSVVSLSEKNKESFLKIKNERSKYYSQSEEYKKSFKSKIEIEKGKYASKKIKQYFDYGWCEENGRVVLNLEQLCRIAGLKDVYYLVDEIINSFSHGQTSIFKFSRHKDSLDKKYISHLFEALSILFFKMVRALIREFGSDVLSEREVAAVDMIYALSSDLNSSFFEEYTLEAINSEVFSGVDKALNNMLLLDKLLLQCSNTNDIRQRYLLSQSYVRYLKQIIAAIVRFNYKLTDGETVNSLNVSEIIQKFNPKELIEEYERQTGNSSTELAEFIDSRDSKWLLSVDDTYNVNCIGRFLQILRGACGNSDG